MGYIYASIIINVTTLIYHGYYVIYILLWDLLIYVQFAQKP